MTEPSNETAERAVLGTLMLYPENAIPTVRKLSPDHFFDIKLKTVYRAMLAATDMDEAPSTVRVVECLRRMEKLDAIGGPIFVSDIATELSTPATLDSNLRILEELRQKRQLGRAAANLVDALSNGSDPEEALAAFEKAKGKVVLKSASSDPFSTLDLPRLALEGIPVKDWLIPGWLAADDIAIFAGSGGIGKTTTACAMAVSLASCSPWCGIQPNGCGYRVLWFDEEQGDAETARTFIRLGGHDTTNLQVHSSVGLNLQDPESVAKLEATIAAFQPNILFLDSAQQCLGIKDENNASEVGEVYRTLFRLRSTYNLAIFIVHHKRKSNNQNQDIIELVRGSTTFTTQASMVCLASKGPEDLTLDLKMAKRRGGKKLSIRVRYFEESEDGKITLTSDGTVFRSDNDLCKEWLIGHIAEHGPSKRAILVSLSKTHGWTDKRVDNCLGELCLSNTLKKYPNATYDVFSRLPHDPEK